MSIGEAANIPGNQPGDGGSYMPTLPSLVKLRRETEKTAATPGLRAVPVPRNAGLPIRVGGSRILPYARGVAWPE